MSSTKIVARHADKKEVLSVVTCDQAAMALGLRIRNVSGRLSVICPFHMQNLGKEDYSLGNCLISEDKKKCMCYACGGHGDAIQMVQSYLGLSFTEATDWLAGECAPYLIGEEWNKNTAPKRRFPFAEDEMNRIGLQMQVSAMCPNALYESKYEARHGKTPYDSISSVEEFTDTATEEGVMTCIKKTVTLDSVYWEDPAMFWQIVMPKAVDTYKKTVNHIKVCQIMSEPDMPSLTLMIPEWETTLDAARHVIRLYRKILREKKIA